MSIPKKTRPEAVLKNLPRARQEAILDYLELARIEELVKRTAKDGSITEQTRLRPPTLAETLEWLAKDGIVVSSGALSSWRSDFLLQRQMEANEAAALAVAQEGREQGWLKTAEEERAAGQAFFSRMAIAQQNPKMFVSVERLAIQKDQLAQDKQRLQIQTCETFLTWFADQRAREIADSNLSNADKIARLRQTYFADVEELEKSGEVKLPA